MALALAAREGMPPGVLACGAPQLLGQCVERGERRRPGLAKGEIAAPLVRRGPGGA